jgi:hypothetical protein
MSEDCHETESFLTTRAREEKRVHRCCTTDSFPVWYDLIEEGVRKAVFALRNAGINTVCSCHHDGYIQCETFDAKEELRTIYDVMFDLRIKDYSVEIRRSVLDYHPYDKLEIRSPSFFGKSCDENATRLEGSLDRGDSR